MSGPRTLVLIPARAQRSGLPGNLCKGPWRIVEVSADLSWPKIVEDANQKAERAMDRRRFSRQDNVLQKGPFEEEEG